MQPIKSRMAIREQNRIDQEAIWRQQGEEAAEKGLESNQWPRVGAKYSTIWYRARNAWQAGYQTSIGMPLSRNQIDAADLKPKSLNERLYTLLEARQTVSMREVLRSFSSLDSENVKTILTDWQSQGYVRMTGTGKRGNPIAIEKIES